MTIDLTEIEWFWDKIRIRYHYRKLYQLFEFRLTSIRHSVIRPIIVAERSRFCYLFAFYHNVRVFEERHFVDTIKLIGGNHNKQ